MDQISIRVLLVEDEPMVRDEYRTLIKEHPMLQLVAETDNQEEAVCILEEMPVDVVILDLELPQGSGLMILEKLQAMDIPKPFIAVVTNVVSKVIYNAVRNMGVDYIYTKGVGKGSLETPLSVIEISAPYRRTKEKAESMAGKLNIRTRINIYRRNIEFELSRMGFVKKGMSFSYVEEGILHIMLSRDPYISMTKELYPAVASKYNTNYKNVERNIRLAIEKVWTNQDAGRLREYYPFDVDEKTGRPTNAQFLYNMAAKILRQ